MCVSMLTDRCRDVLRGTGMMWTATERMRTVVEACCLIVETRQDAMGSWFGLLLVMTQATIVVQSDEGQGTRCAKR